jgi:hypothetical protein
LPLAAEAHDWEIRSFKCWVPFAVARSNTRNRKAFTQLRLQKVKPIGFFPFQLPVLGIHFARSSEVHAQM